MALGCDTSVTITAARHTWLAGASAWSGSNAFTDWFLRQYDNNTTVGSFAVDKDDSNGSAGGWKIG